jgi:hypothetical protein
MVPSWNAGQKTGCLGFLRSFQAKSGITHSWSCALLEKPPIMQLLENFPAFYGTRRFITEFTRALHWSLF